MTFRTVYSDDRHDIPHSAYSCLGSASKTSVPHTSPILSKHKLQRAVAFALVCETAELCGSFNADEVSCIKNSFLPAEVRCELACDMAFDAVM